MGEHRNAAGSGSRGVSKGPIIAIVSLIVVAALVFGWFQLRTRSEGEGAAAAAECVEGSATVPVAVSDDIAAPIGDIAARWNATDPVVRDQCVSVVISSLPPSLVAAGLTAPEWDETVGPRPSLWIPTGSLAAASVLERTGSVNGTPKSVAESPLVLAAPADLTSALGAAAVGWGQLPALMAGTGKLDAIGLPGWGSLRLALPPSDASTMTLDAVAIAAADSPTDALTEEQAAGSAVRTAVSQVGLTQQSITAASAMPSDSSAALTSLSGEPAPSTAAVHAVPVTEQQLFQARTSGSSLTAYRPAGATPIADHPAIVLSGVDEAQSRAAAEFVDFVLSPDQQNALGATGFRVKGPSGQAVAPPSTDGLEFAAVRQVAPISTAAASSVIAATFDDPITPTTATVLLDVSGSMDSRDGGGTRLTNTTDALNRAIATLPDSNDVGLWTYSRDLDGNTDFSIDNATGPLDAARRAALTANLAGLRPATATSTYVSATAAYRAAVAGWTPGRSNYVLLITDGPNDDASVTSAQFLADIAAARDPARPVRVDVVSLASNSDLATLTSLSSQTGGELVQTSSADPAFVDTVSRLLAKS